MVTPDRTVPRNNLEVPKIPEYLLERVRKFFQLPVWCWASSLWLFFFLKKHFERGTLKVSQRTKQVDEETERKIGKKKK